MPTITAMVSTALGYDPVWTAKLIRRDFRNIKVKAITKIKARFSHSSSKTAASSPEQVDVVIVEPEKPRSIESSASAAFSAPSSTLYELVEGHLKITWASRDRKVSPNDRWQFRGSWLVLWKALQACPSNDSYDVFNGPKTDEKVLLLEMLEHGATTTSSTPLRASRMPVMPYAGVRPHVRYDSAFGNGTSGADTATKLTPAQLWHGILQGAMDSSRLTLVAEELLAFIWHEEDVAEVLDTIGNPAKHFGADDELRLRLRNLLFPTYNTMSSAPLR